MMNSLSGRLMLVILCFMAVFATHPVVFADRLQYDKECFINTAHTLTATFQGNQNISYRPDGSVITGVLKWNTELFIDTFHKFQTTFQPGFNTEFNPDGSVSAGYLQYDTYLFTDSTHKRKVEYFATYTQFRPDGSVAQGSPTGR